MPNVQLLPECPYYQSETKWSILCEDTYHTFDDRKQRQRWVERYCAGEWKKCKYARRLEEAYEKYLKGDEMALKSQKMDAMQRELRSVSTKLGIVKKKNATLIDQKAELYRQLRATKEELEKVNKDIYQKLMAIAQLYEDRIAYLIDTKCDGELKEADVAEWAKGKEYALTFDQEAEERTWKVLTKEAEEDEQILESEAGE